MIAPFVIHPPWPFFLVYPQAIRNSFPLAFFFFFKKKRMLVLENICIQLTTNLFHPEVVDSLIDVVSRVVTGRDDDGSGTNAGVCTVEAGINCGAVDVLGVVKERGCWL